jgi:hypothetical protein
MEEGSCNRAEMRRAFRTFERAGRFSSFPFGFDQVALAIVAKEAAGAFGPVHLYPAGQSVFFGREGFWGHFKKGC